MVVRHGHDDLGRDVPRAVRALVEERPGDVDIAARPCRDPLFIVEEIVRALVVDHHRSGPIGTAVMGNGHRNPTRRVIREAEVVDECAVVERSVRRKRQHGIAPRLHMFEQTGTARGRVPTRKEDVRERVAAIGAEVDQRAEAVAIVIRRRHDVRFVGRVDNDVLLVLGVVALGAVDQRERGVVHDRVGVDPRERRVQRRRGEGRAPAPGKEDKSIRVGSASRDGLEIVGEEEGVVATLGLVGAERLEVICRRRRLGH